MREPSSARALGLVGIGATVIAPAFTMRPVHTSPSVSWFVLAMGTAVIGAGLLPLGRKRLDLPSHLQRLGADCRLVEHALDFFIREQRRRKPRGRFPGWFDRMDRWRTETETRYRRELRSWVSRVFAEAVACGAASENARSLVEAPAATQLAHLRDVFRDAAERLGRAAL